MSVQQRLEEAVLAINGARARRARRRPHRRRRSCAGAGRPCRSRRATGASIGCATRSTPICSRSPIAVRRRARGRRDFRGALLGDPSALSLCDRQSPRAPDRDARPGLARKAPRSTPTPCMRPRSRSSAATTSRPFAPPNVRPIRRSARWSGSTCAATATASRSSPAPAVFLHNQVRSMAGSLEHVGTRQMERRRSAPTRSRRKTVRAADRSRRRTGSISSPWIIERERRYVLARLKRGSRP